MVMLVSGYNGRLAFIAVLLSMCISVGVAGVGYLSNDVGDSERDRAIGKPNVQQGLSTTNLLLLYALFLSMALLPWLWLPFTRYSAGLITLELVLFFAYSFKPFRLKERGVPGLVADALYAHALPALLAAYTFCLFAFQSVKSHMLFVASLCVWQFLLGLRNILFHQLQDAENDARSGTNTFVVRKGVQASEALVRLLLFAEVVAFAVFVAALASYNLLVLPAVLATFGWIYFHEKNGLATHGYRKLAYVFLDDVYVKWLPVITLALLCLTNTTYASLFLLHFVAFRSRFKTYLTSTINTTS